MEVALCAQAVSNRAVLVMARLNHQRQQDQFCDCVLRLRDNPGQLHPAHRCVLAASSPVLASMLSSAGVLVELQSPYFSDSVLPPLLDYLYTGSIPHNQIQQQHHSLLTAACYLQMDELIVALRACQNELTFADNVNDSAQDENLPHEDMDTKLIDRFYDVQPQSCISAIGRPEETCSSSRWNQRYLLKESAHRCLSNVENFEEIERHSVHHDSSADMETCARRCDTTRGVKSRQETGNASTSSQPGVGCSVVKNIEWKAATHKIPVDFIDNISNPAQVSHITNMDKKVQEDMLDSLKTMKSGFWQEHMDKDRKSSSTVSQSCCGAVPVICHSNKAAIQLAQVPPHQSLATLGLRRTSVLQSTSANDDSAAEGITADHKTQHGSQEQLSERHFGNQPCAVSQNSKEGFNQCVTRDMGSKSTANLSVQLVEAHNSISSDNVIQNNDEYVSAVSSPVILTNIQHANCDPVQNKSRYPKDDPVPQNKNIDCHSFPSKYKRQNNVDSYCSALETAMEENLLNLRRTDSLSGEGIHCEDYAPEREVQKEHSYSSSCQAKADIQVSPCTIYVPEINCLSGSCRAESSKKDSTSIHQKYDTHDTATENKGHAGVFLPVPSLENNMDCTGTSTECHKSMEPDQITPEPQLTLTMSVDGNMCDTMYSAITQRYQGRLHYHCLTDDTSHLHPSHCHEEHPQAHFNLSDQSGDEHDTCAIACSGLSDLKYHNAMEATEQVFLLDISTKPSELLVSSRHTPGNEEEGDGQSDTFVPRLTDPGERTPAGEDLTMPGTDRAETVKVSCFELVDKQLSSWAEGSPPCVSDSVQASIPSTQPVSIPCSLSASTPKNLSPHQSTPISHSFQCTLCDRSFSQRGSLNRHVRSHLGVRPFPCPHCPMTFSRQYRVTEHMRVHQRCIFGNNLPKLNNS